MAASTQLRALIAAVAPLWAGEGEVVRSYWDSPVRSHEADLLWTRRQCSKEFNGKGIGEYRNLGVFMGPVTELRQAFPRIDAGVDRHYALELIEMLHDEFEHYVLIADIYDAIRRPDEPPINAQNLETWPEDKALTELRFKHMLDHGEIGDLHLMWCREFRGPMRPGWRSSEKLTGGTILEKNCHHFDLFNWSKSYDCYLRG